MSHSQILFWRLPRLLFATLWFCIVATLNMSTAAQAQELVKPKARQGYYYGVGLSAVGAIHLDIENEDDFYPTLYGSGFQFRFGQTVTDWAMLGLVFDFANASGDRFSSAHPGLMLEGVAQLAPNLGLHISAGAGAAQVQDTLDPDETTLGTGGAMYGLGLSYDIFLKTKKYDSGGFALSPGVYARYHDGNTWQAYTVWAGLEARWYKGHPKNQLELDLEQAFQ